MAEKNLKDMNLYEKLAKIRKGTEVIQKNKSGFNYKYTSIDVILAHVTAGMNKYNVSLIPKFENGAIVSPYTYTKVKMVKGERVEEQINEFVASSPVTYVWINNDTPEEKIEVPWFVTGSQQDPSQAMGSALTYSLRYFLTQYFQIATPEDDPDSFRSKQRAAELAEDKALAEKIIEDLDAKVKAYLSANEKKADDVKKFISQYVKSSNYFNITESSLAAKLLHDFTAEFLKEDN